MGNTNNRVMTFAVRLLFVVLALSFTAKGDSLITWDVNFYTVDVTTRQPNGVASGSATFETLPLTGGGNPYFPLVSISGTMNGGPISGGPCFLCGVNYYGDVNGVINPYEAFLGNTLQFNGLTLMDVDTPGGAFGGDTLFGDSLPLNAYGGFGQLLNLTLTQEPVSASEGPSIVLLLVGLAGLGLFWKRPRPGSLAADGSI